MSFPCNWGRFIEQCVFKRRLRSVEKIKMRPDHVFRWPVVRYGDRTAIVYQDTRVTYFQMDARINRFSHGLLSLGLTTGRKVAVLINNCLECVTAIFGIPRAGLVYVSLNSRHSVGEHIAILNDIEADAIICGAEFSPLFEPVLSAVPSLKHAVVIGPSQSGWLTFEELTDGQPETVPAIDVGAEDVVRIQYSSGTTGRPKGVVWTYRIFENVITSTLVNMDQLIEPSDVNLNCGPLTHAAGLMLMSYYSRGATNVVLPGFDEEEILKTVEKEQISSILLIPTMLYRVLMSPNLSSYDLSSVKRIWYGTAPMAVERLTEGIKVFGGVFRQNYGMTEMPQPITFLGPEEHLIDGTEIQKRRLSSAGRPALGVELKIVDEYGREIKNGEVGEILIRSNKLMKEYWKMPVETAEAFKGGWFHTRDMGRMDEDGYVYIIDRKSDMIISGGFNIYPREVEEVLLTHSGVREAVVFSVPDEIWGEAVKAVVVPKEGSELSEAELIRHCKENLASYKKPSSVDFVEEIAKNPYGKVDRKSLKEPYWRDLNRRVH